jgi:hypothetical protein
MNVEVEKEEARLRAAMRPERLDFIDRVLRVICATGVPFQWWHGASKRSIDASGRTFRTDFVHLQVVSCEHKQCPTSNHVINLTCFPERISSSMSEQPDAVMLLRSPYQTSVRFWSRVCACVAHGFDVFRTTKNTEDVMRSAGANRLIHPACLSNIARALDYIFTCVLDHITTVADPYTRERVLPRCFASVPRVFPHAFAAHVHRWGTSTQNPLPISLPSTDFWQTFDLVRASLQLPVSVDTAHYVFVDGDHDGRWLEYSVSAMSHLRLRFPDVVHVVADGVLGPFGAEVLATFREARSVELLRMSYAPRDARLTLKSLVTMPNLEQCVVTFAPTLGPRFTNPDPYPVHRYTIQRTAQDICHFIKLRRGLQELAAADYLSTPQRPLPSKEEAPMAWLGFFGSPIFERQTLGIVARFLYEANYIDVTKQRLDQAISWQ